MEEERPLRFSSKLSDELQNINLTPAQGYILSRIDGSSCARDIVSLSPVPEAEAAETLLDLISKGLVTWDNESGKAAPDKKILSASEDDGESALESALLTAIDRILRLARERCYPDLLASISARQRRTSRTLTSSSSSVFIRMRSPATSHPPIDKS